MTLTERLVIESVRLRFGWSEVMDEDVGGAEERFEVFAIDGVVESECHGLLAAVPACESGPSMPHLKRPGSS